MNFYHVPGTVLDKTKSFLSWDISPVGETAHTQVNDWRKGDFGRRTGGAH